MPIARIQLPNGNIAKFEVEEGTTPEQVVEFANQQFSKSRIIDEQPQQAAAQTPVKPQMTRLQALGTVATNIPFAPRIKAGISALTAKTMGGDESIGQFYDEALNNELSKLKKAREQYPKQSFATQLGTDILVGGKLLKSIGIRGVTAKQALTGGAILGGITAAGETKERLASEQGLTDIASGGLYGAGGGLLGQQIGKAIGKSAPLVKKTIQRFKGSTPESVMSNVITPEEAGQQASKLANKIKQGRITTLPEQSDENILALTRILGKTQGSNKIINEYINTKSAGSARRVGDLINNNLSAENYFNKLDDTIARRKELSAPLYQKAEIEGEKYLQKLLKKTKSSAPTIDSVNPTGSIFTKYQPNIRAKANLADNITTLDKTLNVSPNETITIFRGAPKNQKSIVSGDFITTNYQLAKDYAGDGIVLVKKVKAGDILDDITEPLGEEYIYRANNSKIAHPQTKLYDNPNISKYVNMAKNEPLFVDPRLSDNSFVVLKGAKEMIDRDINLAIKNQDFTTSKALYGVKKQVLDILEKASPSYKEANKIFAGETVLKNAQEEGLKFNQYRNGEEVKRAFNKLSSGEKETFKIGVKDYLMDKVAKASDRNPAKTIFGSQLEREKLKAVFNNPKEFNNFGKKLYDEIRVFDVKQRIVGGSRTDFNIEEQAQLLDKVAKGAINFKSFGLADVALATKDAIKRRYYGLNEQTAKELANIMIDPRKSVELLNNIAKKAQTNAEKKLIQKFAEDLSRKNFIGVIAPTMGRAMATEQLNNKGD